MPKGHSTIGSQRALLKRMGTQRIGITITATVPGTGAEATIYVAGLTLGTLTDAQKDSFRDQLAAVLNVSSDLITLTFESGSLIVGITINPSQISTPSDNAFVVNAQAVLSQLTNTNISNIITASGTSAVITGSPVIDPARTTATITPTLQTISSSNYTIQTFNNPIVGDDVNRCMYTLVNSNIVRINSNGLIDIVCSFPESTIDFIFITANAGFLVIPSNNFEEYDGILYNGRYANKVYLVNISSGTVYMNTTEIAYAQGFGFGFNQFNNKIYYGSAEVGTLGQNYMSTIEFSNTNIAASITTIPQFVINSIVFSDVNTGFTVSNNSIVKVDLLNNNFTVIAGGHSDLTYRQLGTWDNVTTSMPDFARTWISVGGGAYDPFADSSNGATAWFCFISSSKLVLDTANNRLLVCDRYAQRIRAINLTTNYAVTTLAGTSPISYGHAINNNGSTFSGIELSSMGQVGVWGGSASGMPEFSKVNSTYALSTFNEPSNIALFNNTILVLDLTGTRILSNGYVNDLIVLDKKTDPVLLSSLGDATVTFKISNASYLSELTSEEITNLRTKFLLRYPFITSENMSLSLTNESITVTLTYTPSLDINLFSKYELSTISNLVSVFSDSESILTNFKDAVTYANASNKFDFFSYGQSIEIGSGYKTPYGVAVDSVGNVYVADTFNYKIKKVTPSGIITEIGSGFGQTSGVAVDSVGNVYVADLGNNKVKKVSPSGIITEIGSGFSLPTGVAVDSVGNVYVTDSATTQIKKVTPSGIITEIASGFSLPTGVAVDSVGNVYVAEAGNNKIKKVTPSGIITEIGSGFNRPRGVAIDSVGNVYVTDGGNFKIKKVTPSGIITEIASGFSPYGVALDSVGNVYVADSANNKIKKVTPSSIITEIGSGYNDPHGVALDSVGNVYVADSANNKIKKVTPSGIITEIGSGYNAPKGVAVDSVGNVYVADSANDTIKKVTPSGIITEIASGFFNPYGVAIDSVGNVYVADTNDNKIKKVTPSGIITEIGSGFDHPRGVAIDSVGNVYVADLGNNNVKKVTPSGIITEIGSGYNAPRGVAVDSVGNVYVTDGGGNDKIKKVTPSGIITEIASGFSPYGVALDSVGNVYVADYGNNKIKKVTPSSIITEIGSFRYVTGLAVDSSGNIYVCDNPTSYSTGVNDGVIKKITPNGTVTTIATEFSRPWALYVDSLGNVYVADTYNRLVKKISPAGVITEIGTGFGHITGIAVDSLDNIYVSDQENKIVKKIDGFGITTFTTGDELTGIHVDSSNNVYVCYGSSGILRKFAPNGTVMFTKDGFGNIYDIAIDSSYNIYVTDSISNSVKKLTPSGSVTTFATGFNGPSGIAIDSSDNIYVSDTQNKQIKKIARINAVINDADITVNVSNPVVNKCNEKVPQLNPLIMCFGPDKIYTWDLKNSIVILDQNNGTTSILTTIPPVGSYISRSLEFKGITTDGKYLTVIEQYKFDEVRTDNNLSNYVYRIDTTNGNFVKVTLFATVTYMPRNTFYNNFTDTLYYKEVSSSSQPVPYKFTGLSTFITGTSTEIFPSRTYGLVYLDKDTVSYVIRDRIIKKWNLVTGVETNVIGTEYPMLKSGGKYNYTSPVQFANISGGYFENVTSYDSITDTLAFTDNSAKCVILIKNVLNGTAFIDRIIGTPNTDLDSNGFVNTIKITKPLQNGNSTVSGFTANYSGTNKGLTSNIVFTDPQYVYITPGTNLIFVLNFDRSIYLNIPTLDDIWKCYSVSKIQRTIVAPFTLYNTTNPPGLTVSATYSTSTASIYVAGLTLGALTQTQQDAFKAQLAIILGVTPDLLTLTFTAGSLIVGISINKSKIITASDDAFVINAPAILAQLTNADINTIITNSGTGISITGTANIDHSRIEINIDIDLRRDCLSKYRNRRIRDVIVADDTNKCMYTLLDSKILRINKNGKVSTICDFPESSIRHMFITSNNEYLIIPSNIFSYDNVNASGQTNLPYATWHTNKIYVVKISDGSIYINTTTVEFLNIIGYNNFTNTIYYQSSETNTYVKIHQSDIIFTNSSVTSLLSLINSPNLSGGNILIFSVTNKFLYCAGVFYLVNINGSITRIAGLNSGLGAWSNVTGNNNWNNANGSVYSPFADASIGTNASFNFPQSIVYDNLNNRILVADTYSQRIRALDLSNNNYAVTTLAGTSPVFYGRAINDSGSTYTTQELASMGQVGIWNNPVSGMPAFSKVNSTYALSTFNEPSNIALFDNTILVLDVTGMRILSNGRVNDFTVLTQ